MGFWDDFDDGMETIGKIGVVATGIVAGALLPASLPIVAPLVEAGIGGATISAIGGVVGGFLGVQGVRDNDKADDYDAIMDTHTLDDQEALENRMSNRVSAHSNKPK